MGRGLGVSWAVALDHGIAGIASDQDLLLVPKLTQPGFHAVCRQYIDELSDPRIFGKGLKFLSQQVRYDFLGDASPFRHLRDKYCVWEARTLHYDAAIAMLRYSRHGAGSRVKRLATCKGRSRDVFLN